MVVVSAGGVFQIMSNCYCLLAVVLLSVKLEAIPTQTNVDVQEPSVRISPDDNADDAFGWSAILHHLSPPDESDDMSQALGRIRLVIHRRRNQGGGGGYFHTRN